MRRGGSRARTLALTAACAGTLAGAAAAGPSYNWPQWRGPAGQGVSAETDLPSEWSTTENVAWKTAIPGRGHSSPIVWGDRVLGASNDDAIVWGDNDDAIVWGDSELLTPDTAVWAPLRRQDSAALSLANPEIEAP